MCLENVVYYTTQNIVVDKACADWWELETLITLLMLFSNVAAGAFPDDHYPVTVSLIQSLTQFLLD